MTVQTLKWCLKLRTLIQRHSGVKQRYNVLKRSSRGQRKTEPKPLVRQFYIPKKVRYSVSTGVMTELAETVHGLRPMPTRLEQRILK